MWSDNETTTDFLNFEDTVESVVHILTRKDLKPMSLGLFGGWGSGKSSMLRMVEKKISETDDAIVLIFDAWVFQGYDDARAALLETIGSHLLEISQSDPSLKTKAISLLKRVDAIRALGLAGEAGALAMGIPLAGMFARALEGSRDMIAGEGDREDFDAVKTASKAVASGAKGILKPAEAASPPEAIDAFRKEFSALLDEMDKTLYVFIDNLDRCLPTNAIHTLEAIKQFLFMENTTFVIAADETMIRHAVREHYKSFDDRITTDYLDKLVQYPIRIPSVGVLETRALLLLLIAHDDQIDPSRETLSPEERSALQVFMIERLQQSWEKTFPTVDEMFTAKGLDALTEKRRQTLRDADQISGLASEILATAPTVKGNPRIVKRLLNTLYQRKFIAQRRGIPLNEAAIMKLVIFERCAGERATREFYRLIAESPDGKLPFIAALEAGDLESEFPEIWEESRPFVVEWAKLLPPLGEIDLRPAVYLARDLRPTQIGFTGLDEEAQAAFEGLMIAERRSSAVVQDIIKKLPDVQKPAVMDALISKLANISDWTKQPSGWPGAMAIAATDDACAKKLTTFANRQITGSLPQWMSRSLKSIQEVEL